MTAAGLYAGQDMLLYHLSVSAEEGISVSDLAEKICVQAATVSNMIRRMEANGLIKKEADGHDKRAFRVSLTQKGKDTFKEVAVIWRAVHQQTTEGLTTEEMNLLTIMLQKVMKNIK
jgi:DNA-binding MarR family transcriptional regulator